MTLYGAPIRGTEWLPPTDWSVVDPEEPWSAADLTDGATCLTGWWVYLTAAIAAALVAVLVVIGIRRFA